MNKISLSLAIAAASCFSSVSPRAAQPDSVAAPAATADIGQEKRAVIDFANLPHRIDSWQPDGSRGIYLKVGIRNWYYAAFTAPCLDLPYRMSIGIVTDGLDQVDRFSSILVKGPSGLQRCWFQTLTKVEGPPPRTAHEP